VACTGVHGANRLASNSLLEALVFGARVARSLAATLPHLRRPGGPLELPPSASAPAVDDLDAAAAESAIRRVAWENVGLVRTASGLRGALAGIEAVAATLPSGPTRARNLAIVVRLVATAALARPESRGAHFRADHPAADPAWRRRILLARAGGPDGTEVLVETQAVPAVSPGFEAYA
jgi:L-aspartate oxidase